jgi:signal peptidase I
MSTITGDPLEASARRRHVWRVMRWGERGFAVVGFFAVVYVLTLDVSVIASPSMQPTLQGTGIDNGDHVVTEKVTRWFRRPRRWEVIAFTRDDGTKVMKRVAGMPGESVQLTTEGRLLVDGRPVEIPSSLNQKFLGYGNLGARRPVPCGGGYYVLGDDSKDSDDSRFNGSIDPDRVVGRAWFIVWPLSRCGFVR